MAAEARRIAAAGRSAGKPLRGIAVDLYGAARVEAEWTPGGWMPARVRRPVRRAGDAPPLGAGPGCCAPAGGRERGA